MDDSRKELLRHVAELAAEGQFGEPVRHAQDEYASLPAGIAVFLKCVDDYCKQNEGIDRETRSFRDTVCKLLIVAYREGSRADAETCGPFVSSLISDYPGAPESALLTRWCAMAQACLAFREVSTSNNRALIWQQMKGTFGAYNEFLDGLLGHLLILQRCASGKPVKPGVFDCAYSEKVRQFNDLTGGDNGAFHIFGSIARPAIRNAAAHGRLWLDSKRDLVRYVDGKPRKERTVPLAEFASLVLLGSHLTMPYLAAIGTLVVVECGTDQAKGLLPKVLVDLWQFRPEGN